ncbi:hypothetical protein PDESU_00473 [Pontiella desulfatans]|uniref:Metal-dependent hydrolase n=1 Tax=Pontiella desulfatans TaxID=2750659 RepID=A0A6C2TW75_PONDE|nr:metal-dependent hydrolase [Pontiella desulfatans]VGO11925.1 hypothetical protein PDESU_00473 [Pontiella desulfatans]
MKGISHFISGVAVASCFPWAVAAALEKNPAYFILGAAFGILPDTIDFKFYRFFYRYHQSITPDPRRPDPQAIADRIAEAVSASLDQKGMFRLKINTLRLSADQWRQFRIRFDPQRQGVEVELGPVVTTGQLPVPGSFPEADAAKGWARLAAPIEETYEAVTTVDIFDGPAFGFEQDADGRVNIHFLPWHRSWTHSLVLGAALAAPMAAWLGWRAGIVAFCAYAIHILEDQLGFMGSNLFAPFTKRRLKGLHWMRSGDALPNFATVWFCCMLVFWNCYRIIPDPTYHFGFIRLMLYGFVAPLGLYGLLHFLLNRKSLAREPIDSANEWGEGF